MLIRAGYRISLQCPQATPMIALLHVHPSRVADLRSSSSIATDQDVTMHTFPDQFGNLCTRAMAPAGTLTFSSDFIIEDSGMPDEIALDAPEVPVEDLPDDTL